MNSLELFSQNKTIQSWIAGSETLARQLVMGLSGSSKAMAIASQYISQENKVIVVTASQNEAEKLAADLSALIGEENVYQFFSDDVAAAEFIFSSLDKAISRIEAIQFLNNTSCSGILITSVIGLRTLLPNPKVFKENQLTFAIGSEYDLETLVKQLSILGYQKVSQVTNPVNIVGEVIF